MMADNFVKFLMKLLNVILNAPILSKHCTCSVESGYTWIALIIL